MKSCSYLKKLEALVGEEVIRINPVEYATSKDYSYCDCKLLFLHFNPDGSMKVKHIDGPLKYKVYDLPIEFSDGNWRPASIVSNGKRTKFGAENKNRLIIRTQRCDNNTSFMLHPVRLITQTKYHMVVETANKEKYILDKRYVDQNWKVL